MVNFRKFFKLAKRNITQLNQKNKAYQQQTSLKYQKIYQSVKFLLEKEQVKTEDIVLRLLKQQNNQLTKEDNLLYLQDKYKLNKDDAIKFLQYINFIWTYLDKTQKGFLSQDLNINLLNNFRILLERQENLETITQQLFKQILQKNMSIPENGIPNVDLENQHSLFVRQLQLEQLSEINSISIDHIQKKNLIEIDSSESLQFYKEIIEENLESFINILVNEQNKCYGKMQAKGTSHFLDYERIFLMLNPEQWSIICINNIISCIVQHFNHIIKMDKDFSIDLELDPNQDYQYFLNTLRVVDQIVQQTRIEFIYQERYKEYKQYAIQNKKKIIGLKDFKEGLQQRNIKIKPFFALKSEIDNKILKKIATKLIEFAKVTLRIPGSQKNNQQSENTLIFQVIEIFHQKKLIENKYIKLRPKFLNYLSRQIDQSSNQFLHLDRAFPQIHKPLEWQDITYGGYYINPTPFMKFYNNNLHKIALESTDLSRIFKVVDYISQTEWQIDNFLLDTIKNLWNLGGGRGSIPKRYDRDEYKTQKFQFHHQENYKLDRETVLQHRQNYFNLLNNSSLKCDFLLKYESAQALSNVEKIYFPHNLDFRGRIYPVPPHLNHMGADLSRALLTFSQKKPLGKKGLRWLKIHCCNKIGYDKLKMDDREAYIDDNIGKLMKWVEDPIKNDQWLELENCWQSLGALKELKNALDSNYPEDYCSNMPIHQDGSCNGLQHYAALGRDSEGAFEVNLIKRDKPGDVYTKVMQLVITKIKEQQQIESDPQQKIMLKKILACIERKTIKQTVMTIVYGVTFLGARDQIQKQLKTKFNYETFYELKQASNYIARLTLSSVGDLFKAASNIKEFFKKCSSIVGKCNQPMAWITPIGLPVIQPYIKEDTFDLLTSSSTELKLKQYIENSKVNASKQRTAFPPNYIHSLDSTHLLFTAERMRDAGLQFASVHDSFWTHPSDVDQMNKFLREEFVKLYSMPLLEILKQDLETRFPNQQFPEIPEKGTLDLNEVLHSEYFFSQLILINMKNEHQDKENINMNQTIYQEEFRWKEGKQNNKEIEQRALKNKASNIILGGDRLKDNLISVKQMHFQPKLDQINLNEKQFQNKNKLTNIKFGILIRRVLK